MNLVFFLQAQPKFKEGEFRVLEFFKAIQKRTAERGKVVESVTIEQVDDGVRQSNAREYAVFQDFVSKNQDELYEAAKKTPGVPYFFDYKPKKVSKPLVEEEPVAEKEPELLAKSETEPLVKEVTRKGLFKKKGKEDEAVA